MTTRECGACSLCCKLLGVEELHKPAGIWCKHAVKPHGCNRYETRPDSCHQFQCAWLDERYNLPVEFKPDRIKAVIRATAEDEPKGIIVFLDDGYPTQHLTEPLKGFIDAMAGRMTVKVVHKGKWSLFSAGEWKKMIPLAEELTCRT